MQVLKMMQQGDVNIIEIEEFPKFETYHRINKIENGVVREGTATGHSHRIVGTEFELFTITWPTQMFVEIKSTDCKLVHEEHETIDLPVGKYEFVQTTEYDHFREESRRVVD